ncbi:MAG: sulfite exporter TauE/SafE family protein [Thermaceae bacterium]|nr:sulfite exporter TauE/SafE family protein [Thermaceae bacterium]
MDLSPYQWVVAFFAAVIVGGSKSGLPGAGVLAVALFAQIFPAKESTGALLPVLLVGDVLAVTMMRRHANWPQLLRIFPWTAVGVLAGVWVLAHINNAQLRLVIGVLVVGMTLYQFAVRLLRQPQRVSSHSRVFAASMGITAGLTTMIANAAGPFTTLYLLAMQMGKLEFVGTTAWFYFAVNLFKMPLASSLGLITLESLRINLLLVPAVIAGAFGGRWLLHRIHQGLFENAVLILALLGGLNLLF